MRDTIPRKLGGLQQSSSRENTQVDMKHHKIHLLKRSAKSVERFQQRFDSQTSEYNRGRRQGAGVHDQMSGC